MLVARKLSTPTLSAFVRGSADQYVGSFRKRENLVARSDW